MINFSNITFIKSASCKGEAPNINLPDILIVGRSNVGKSSLINALGNRKRLAFTSSKPGHTRLLNYYSVDNKFFLVDAPGYGYANGGVDLDASFGRMMEDYLTDTIRLKAVLFLLDARREFSNDDIEIIDTLKALQIPFYYVITKCDKINQKEKAVLLKRLAANNIPIDDTFLTSSLEKATLDKLKKAIEKVL